MKEPSLDSIRGRMRERGHAFFENGAKPYNLNIVGVRNPRPELDAFKCRLTVSWAYKGQWSFSSWPVTTLPGEYYLRQKLLNVEGCAILVPGQYRGAYGIAKHRGKYEAMCQASGPVKVYRDGNRDRVFDLKPATIDDGWFGINHHRANANGTTPKVGANSAGCQVFQSADDFEDYMRLCRNARARWGNKFTYTLLAE